MNTPAQIATYAALCTTSAVVALLSFLIALKMLHPNWYILFFLVVLCFMASFSIIHFFLRRYIQKKIQLLYQLIHRAKSHTVTLEDKDIKDNIFEKVEREVRSWVQEKKREIEDLRQLEEYRRNFLGNISHELKTPIFNIQGFVYTLLEGGVYDETINMKYLRRASTNVERLQNIVEDLEVISKLDSGQMAMDFQLFDLSFLVLEVFEDLEMKASEKNISLKIGADISPTCKVRADREAIRQVLMNLIQNSIKYGKENGNTTINWYNTDNKYWLIEVVDNGIGIEEKHQKHVFDRFYRVDKSRSRDEGGSGLGLSIVKHIVEAHGQTVHVRSTYNIGSSFRFMLQKS